MAVSYALVLTKGIYSNMGYYSNYFSVLAQVTPLLGVTWDEIAPFWGVTWDEIAQKSLGYLVLAWDGILRSTLFKINCKTGVIPWICAVFHLPFQYCLKYPLTLYSIDFAYGGNLNHFPHRVQYCLKLPHWFKYPHFCPSTLFILHNFTDVAPIQRLFYLWSLQYRK